MTSHSTIPDQPQSETETALHLFDNWFDPIEAGLRDRAREFLQAMFEGELDEVLDRSRYVRRGKRSTGDSEANVGITGHRPRRCGPIRRPQCCRNEIVQKARARSSRRKERDWPCKELLLI